MTRMSANLIIQREAKGPSLRVFSRNSRASSSRICAGVRAVVLFLAFLLGSAIASPSVPVPAEPPPDRVEGRGVEKFSQTSPADWNYDKPQENSFYVVHPVDPKKNAPLYVVLHSAGQDLHIAFASAFAKTRNQHYDVDLFHPPGDFYALYLDCRATMPTDWWWGWDGIKANASSYAKSYYPTERRVMETVLWAIQKYDIDPDRVYLAGLSMGGSGSLGLGMTRGDIFAAIQVWVPAGTEHFMFRNKNPISERATALPESEALSVDPPYLVALSAPNDDWSKNQGKLLRTAREQRLPLVYGWGPFGHSDNYEQISAQTPAAVYFPWLSISRNQAYPVFLNASTDQKDPWTQPPGDVQGQINAYFRWKTLEDAADSIQMELRLAAPGEFPVDVSVPDSSTVDLTLRRLQKFQPRPGGTLTWTLGQDGKTLQNGEVTVDPSGNWIIPQVAITKTPSQLQIKQP